MKLTKKYWLLFFVLMCIVNLVMFFNHYSNGTINKFNIGVNLVNLTGEIQKDTPVSSSFVGNGEIPLQLEVFFSTYARENSGEIFVTISDDKEVICECSSDMELIGDNQFFSWDLKNCKALNKGSEYTISVHSNVTENGISGWTDENGNLVASIYTAKTLSAVQIIIFNLFYAVVNYVFCLLLYLLRRKG